MLQTPRRLRLCVAAFALFATTCASAQSIELARVRRADVQVLPGQNGFVHPLTGIVSYSPQEWQQRAVLAVKVGNSGAERPQAGIDRADVIYEEIVEGGITRFLAVFSTNEAPRVGPVRSVRDVDPEIVQPMRALFAYSGGVPPVVSKLRSTPGVTDVGGDRVDAYRRDSSREMPYNLYTATDQLWQAGDGEPPPPQFDFLSTADDPTTGGEEVANEVRLAFAGNSAEVKYSFDTETGRYRRFNNNIPHMIEGDVHLAFRNVLVQMVDTAAGSTTDRAGERSRIVEVVGDGSAILFRGGRALRGRWTRSSTAERTRFIDDSGQPLRLAPGETIVELLPEGRDVFVN